MKREYSKNDFFTQKAKEENYPARSVYKLQEIDNKFKIFKKGDWVLDLGASPGSWLLYIGNKVSITGGVIGVDILDLNTGLPKNATFIKANVLSDNFFDILIRCCHPEQGCCHTEQGCCHPEQGCCHPEAKPKDLSRDSSLSFRTTEQELTFNVVVSDMAPNTTGLLQVDVANCLELTRKALEIAQKRLAKGGKFVCKIFEGPGVDLFVKETKRHFKSIKRYRPQAVRKGSKEIYLIAKGFSPQL